MDVDGNGTCSFHNMLSFPLHAQPSPLTVTVWFWRLESGEEAQLQPMSRAGDGQAHFDLTSKRFDGWCRNPVSVRLLVFIKKRKILYNLSTVRLPAALHTHKPSKTYTISRLEIKMRMTHCFSRVSSGKYIPWFTRSRIHPFLQSLPLCSQALFTSYDVAIPTASGWFHPCQCKKGSRWVQGNCQPGFWLSRTRASFSLRHSFGTCARAM